MRIGPSAETWVAPGAHTRALDADPLAYERRVVGFLDGRSGLCLDREFGAGARERVDGVPVGVVEVAARVGRMADRAASAPHDEPRREVVLAVLQRAGEGRAQPRRPAGALLEVVEVVAAVAWRDSSLSSAAVRQTEKNADGRRLSDVPWRVGPGDESAWWCPPWIDAPAMTAS